MVKVFSEVINPLDTDLRKVIWTDGFVLMLPIPGLGDNLHHLSAAMVANGTRTVP